MTFIRPLPGSVNGETPPFADVVSRGISSLSAGNLIHYNINPNKDDPATVLVESAITRQETRQKSERKYQALLNATRTNYRRAKELAAIRREQSELPSFFNIGDMVR